MQRRTISTRSLDKYKTTQPTTKAPGVSVAAFASDPKADERERDLFMLNGLIDSGELTDNELEAFGDMLEKLDARVWTKLTGDQRGWVADKCDAYGVNTDPTPPKPIPRGREVPLPEVLQHLPAKPPVRRAPV